MSLPLVCVTLTGCTVDEMLKDAARATAAGADIVEVRLDKLWVIDFKTSSKSDIFKYQLCQEFVKVLKEEKITQVELARKLGVDKSIVNKIILHKILFLFGILTYNIRQYLIFIYKQY